MSSGLGSFDLAEDVTAARRWADRRWYPAAMSAGGRLPWPVPATTIASVCRTGRLEGEGPVHVTLAHGRAGSQPRRPVVAGQFDAHFGGAPHGLGRRVEHRPLAHWAVTGGSSPAPTPDTAAIMRAALTFLASAGPRARAVRVLPRRRAAAFTVAPAQVAGRCLRPIAGCRPSRGNLRSGRGTPAATPAGEG